jgi:hypothetical protein
MLGSAVVTRLRRHTQTEAEKQLQQMAYSGQFDCQTLDNLSPALHRRSVGRVSRLYGLASLYLQLGDVDQANDVLTACGKPTRAMNWYAMLMLHCRTTGRPYPSLSTADEKCLDILQQRYTGIDSVQSDGMSSGLLNLFKTNGGFAVLGNAPAPQTAGQSADNEEQVFPVTDDVVIGFNNYHLNKRITVVPKVHVVTPSVTPPSSSSDQDADRHLIITGNAIFYRRSKVWRRFGTTSYRAIHTFPRALWSSLHDQLQASPSAGLLMLACIDRYVDVTDKSGLIGGFSESVPVTNHSFDREPVSDAHNWPAELGLRKRILENLQQGAKSLRVMP